MTARRWPGGVAMVLDVPWTEEERAAMVELEREFPDVRLWRSIDPVTGTRWHARLGDGSEIVRASPYLLRKTLADRQR
ncbi:hypothetical protein ACFO4E_24530 [Nocardiopsis mangrovi]|uniref:Uncharacterized protein n=1 Tax=Nocardiopsis mangrovi TaxID=1179818 RepID=A0ABV9E462_9ACTN